MRQLKPSTRARYEGIVSRHIVPVWGTVRLGDVSHADMAARVAALSADGLVGSTVRYIHRVLSLVLDLAVKDGRLARNPAVGVRLPRASKPDKHFLSHRQVDDLAHAAGDYRLAVLVLAYCGPRWGELAPLRVRREDLMRRRLDIAEAVTEVRGHLAWGTPKGHQQRSVPIPRFLVDELASHLAGKHREDLVVTSRRGRC